MTISVLKPKETALFENEQKSRFSPDAVEQIVGLGKDGVITFSADATPVLDSGITIHNRMGGSFHALKLIVGATQLVDPPVVDNGSYPLANDGVVNPVSQLAVVLIDVDDSITNYVITIMGTDAADAAISDTLTFSSGGEVQFTANGPYKTVTSIAGGVITGTFAGDLLRVVPRLETSAHAAITRAHDPFFSNNFMEPDPNTAGSDSRGAYVEAIDMADKEVRCSFPSLPATVVEVTQIVIQYNTKNIGAPLGGGVDFILRHTGVNYIVGNNSGTQTEGGSADASTAITFLLALGTGLPWTIAVN